MDYGFGIITEEDDRRPISRRPPLRNLELVEVRLRENGLGPQLESDHGKKPIGRLEPAMIQFASGKSTS